MDITNNKLSEITLANIKYIRKNIYDSQLSIK